MQSVYWWQIVIVFLLLGSPAFGETIPGESPNATQDLDLSPEIIENSPVLQRWLKEVPNVLEDIRNDLRKSEDF